MIDLLCALHLSACTPEDRALQAAHHEVYRSGAIRRPQPCASFAALAEQELRKAGKKVWFADRSITQHAGRTIPARRHRFVLWEHNGTVWCADLLYPYATPWDARRISAGILRDA